ncbi:glycosyltransferase [Clostridium sp. AL.422]|uniref:glycosyltransferase n=1 Tax=Clostridium TaxID=1485 RepID=UPI00293DCF34|nr:MULTISPECIES: glycosyltransferase [unclassified Clostridium]MDV4150425.1 glycosyltransferase [Clostridium sp. AL.422]
MNILYVNSSTHLGGDTKCILKLCKELKNNNKLVLASAGGKLLQEFLKIGVKHYKVKDPSLTNIFSILWNIVKTIKIVRKENIELIHSHHRLTTLISKIASFFTGVKVIHTQHLCIEDKFFFTRLALKNIDVISVSNSVKKVLVEKCKLDKKRITTIYNTVEIKEENKSVDKVLVDNKKRFFTVAQISRIVDYKGVYDFVDVAKEVTKTNKNIKFFLIGEGEELEGLKEYINNNSLNEDIYLLGSKDNIIDHLKYIDVVLLCSYVEGLPLVPLESFSQRVPVIATNIPGTNEEVINGFNGYLVPLKDIKAFSSRINQLYEDKVLYKSLKKGAYRTFAINFTKEKYILSHLEIYKKILKSSR